MSDMSNWIGALKMSSKQTDPKYHRFDAGQGNVSIQIQKEPDVCVWLVSRVFGNAHHWKFAGSH